MSEILRSPVTAASAWVGADLEGRDDLIYRLSDGEIGELDKALRSVEERGLDAHRVTRDDFVLPGFGKTLAAMLEQLEHGSGFLLIRGFPRERYTEQQCGIAHWGVGTHFGRGLTQNSQGELLGHIRDAGREMTVDNTVRGYQTRIALPYHTDAADLVGLFCLHDAKQGGGSSLLSSMTVYNRFLERRPDLIEELYQPFHYDRRGEEAGKQRRYSSTPIYAWHRGNLSCRYVRGYIKAAQRFPEVPRLSARQTEALDLIDEIIDEPDMPIVFKLEPGDMEYANNYVIMHARTAFEDWPEPERRRHLLRLWLNVPDGRELPPGFGRGGVTPKSSQAPKSRDV